LISGGPPPPDFRVTLRCLRRDLGLIWPLETRLEDLRGAHALLDAFLDHAPTLRGPGLWLACARPEQFRRFRSGQWRGVSLDEDPVLWLLCGGLRRQGDPDDAYTYCCGVQSAERLAPTDDDRLRAEKEGSFRRSLAFLASLREVMERGLVEARAHPGGEIPCLLSDGESEFGMSLWCYETDGLQELTCVLSLVSDEGVRLEKEQLDAAMSHFLEGRPAAELEFPWTAARPIDPAREYCFRRLI
jgi:hypothetical protein